MLLKSSRQGATFWCGGGGGCKSNNATNESPCVSQIELSKEYKFRFQSSGQSRKMLRVSQMKKRSNASILKELNFQRQLYSAYYQGIVQFFVHIMLRLGDSLENIIFYGKVERRPQDVNYDLS